MGVRADKVSLKTKTMHNWRLIQEKSFIEFSKKIWQLAYSFLFMKYWTKLLNNYKNYNLSSVSMVI